MANRERRRRTPLVRLLLTGLCALAFAVPAYADETNRAYTTMRTKELQADISGDAAALAQIMSLRNSSLMQSILNDRELMQKIAAGDLEALKNDPRLARLARDPVVQDIKRKYGQTP